MKKKKLTNKDRDEIIKMLWKENLENRQHFALYLDYRQKVFQEKIEDYNKFVNDKVEEFEKQQQPQNKEGT